MIYFKKIRWRNFLSTGNQFTEVSLNNNSTTLVIGENGAGKSTILDAICFGLFGKAFRNVNKPQLVNSINQKNCTVEIEFKIGRKEYKVIRGMKPGIFEIYQDNNLLNQDAAVKDYQNYFEDKILKLNYKSFTQIVILGSASFTPFMQLAQGTRREVIEDILDIQTFSVMNNILKNRILETKDKVREIETRIELEKQKVKLQQDYIKQLEEDKKKRHDDVQLKINETYESIKIIEEKIERLTGELRSLSDSIKDDNEISKRRAEMVSLYKSLQTRITKIADEISFYEEHDTCPTCAQILSSELKETAIGKHAHKKEEICTAVDTLNNKIQELEIRADEIIASKQKILEVQNEITSHNTEIIVGQNYIKKLQKEIEETTNNQDSIEEAKIQLKHMAKQVVNDVDNRSKLKEHSFYLDAAATLLKDTGIKTKIIKQYLPVINKLVNKYLAAMDFFVSFELDENFSEVIKSRHRDDFSYASFSEGEKQRIDLALLFTWRTIAKMKNSVSTNLLLLDEVFDSSLDANGTDFVMSLLNTIGEEVNVFVISHKGDQLLDKFGNVIKFEKYQNFSRIN